jgi:hypothetical protein
MDWDSLLSPDELFSHFKFEAPKGDLEKLVPFSFAPLPENFLMFAKGMYSVDMQSTKELALSLITGDILSFGTVREDGYAGLGEWAETVIKNTFCPLLVLRGRHASRALIWLFDEGFMALPERRCVNMRAIYVDEFGDWDYGFEKGLILHLSHDVVDAEIDRLLSHRWMDSLM